MPTSETVCFRYFLDLLMANRRPVMLVGNAGSGKTVLINNKLASLDGDETLVTTIPLNYYTNSLMLQQVIHKIQYMYKLNYSHMSEKVVILRLYTRAQLSQAKFLLERLWL